MKKMAQCSFTIATLTIAISAAAQTAPGAAEPADHAPGPCKKIVEACKSAGFIKGDWKKGDGLWRDCVNPIIQGKTTVPGATKPLPTVDAAAISECKTKHPKFGGGKVGS